MCRVAHVLQMSSVAHACIVRPVVAVQYWHFVSYLRRGNTYQRNRQYNILHHENGFILSFKLAVP